VGISGIKFMVEIGVALGVISFILIAVAIVFMALLSTRFKKQQDNISYIFRRAKEEQRRQEQREDQLLQTGKSNPNRGHRKAGS